jgi:hypothetical protein
MKIFECPMVQWLKMTDESFKDYHYMRVTSSSVLVVDTLGNIGATFTDQFPYKEFEVLPKGYSVKVANR